MNLNEVEKTIKKTSYLQPKYILLLRDIFKYGMVSSAALAVDVGLLYFFVEYVQIHYLHAASFSFICGLAVNYALGTKFVFKQSKYKPLKQFIYYSLIGVIGLGLNDAILYVLVWMNVWYMFAKAVSVALVFFFNFFARRSLFN